MKNKILSYARFVNLEAAIWILGLIFLLIVPLEMGSHLSICPIKNLGFSFCPGCGLGSSIHYLLNFEFKSSVASHPLGIFALFIIICRIFTIVKKNYKTIRIIHNI
jgi:hypothetical protein